MRSDKDLRRLIFEVVIAICARDNKKPTVADLKLFLDDYVKLAL